MALSDLEAFIRERLAIFDDTLDLSPGSPIDAQVVQPILRRLGIDPFSVDMGAFIETRLQQEFPELAIKPGDALTDLLEKPAIVLWDPIVREIQRVKNNSSFKDPTILTIDEAEALGANLVAERNRGDFASGVARIYFAAPQSISITSANFFTSKSGLHFFPSKIQSISVDEMLLNVEGTLFYFDVSLRAELAGDQYNIGPDELVTIANVTSAIRVTNKRRFRFGSPAETAVEFIDRAQQELTERSLVTLRGIAAVIPKTFPDITRLAVIGFNDPEMQRDVLKGGGYGKIIAGGVAAAAAPDGENKVFTRRITVSPSELPIDFLELIGPATIAPVGYMVTLCGAFAGGPPVVRDIKVASVVDGLTLDLEEQVVQQSLTNSYAWALRRLELNLSDIPGGILFPDSPNGTVTIASDSVHIGGATDVLVRGLAFDTNSLVLGAVGDDSPLLSGTKLKVASALGEVSLLEYTLGTNYAVDDGVYTAIQTAALRGWSLQILEGPAAGNYRVIKTLQVNGGSPLFTVSPPPPYDASPPFENLRWKLVDTIDVNLVEPKDTKVSGSDMFSIQNTVEVETLSGVDFDAFGVAPNDILRIFNGPDAGDYKVVQVTTPFFTRIQVDRALKFSTSDLRYSVFRPNAEGGVVRPLIRVTSVELLDTSGQPVGSKVPYAKAVDARSTSFANVGTGIRAQARDGVLGICGPILSGGTPGANVNGKSLFFQFDDGTSGVIGITFVGVDPIPLTSIISQINTPLGSPIAISVDGNRLGFRPIGFTEILGGTAAPDLLGIQIHPVTHDGYMTSHDVQSPTIIAAQGSWEQLNPDLNFDVLQVLDGRQIGFYSNPKTSLEPDPPFPSGVVDSNLSVSHNFAPEAGVFIQFGSRSIGTARVYFLEPTSVEFGSKSLFTTVTNDGMKLNFFPDPTVEAQRVPSLPSGVKPKDGDTTASSVQLSSASIDFVKKGVQAGDVLVIDYKPITGTVNLPDPIAGLQFQTLTLSINGGPDKTIVFLTDSLAIPAGAVTRNGVATQINQAVGQTICGIVPIGGGNYLEFDVDAAVSIRGTGTATAALLGAGFLSGANNTSPNAGRYLVMEVGSPTANDITIDGSIAPFGFANSLIRQQFKIFRPGTQRIGSTQMATNASTAGLYYFDVQLASEGTGDLWNIDANLPMVLVGYESDGYYLSTKNANTTFSTTEDISFHVSRSIREVGVADDPDNATQLSGQNLQINYESSSLVAALQTFLMAETERVVNESPLGRHLVPHFVRFDLFYSGGSRESEITPLVEEYITGLNPNDGLEASDLQQIITGRGANYIINPLDLIAVVYGFDRTVSLNRSSDRLTTGRLAAFIPDKLNITRKLT